MIILPVAILYTPYKIKTAPIIVITERVSFKKNSAKIVPLKGSSVVIINIFCAFIFLTPSINNKNAIPVHKIPIVSNCHQFSIIALIESVLIKKANIMLIIKYCQNTMQ